MIGEAGNRGRLPSIWARNYWCPFIRTKNYMHAAISYVETNPLKEGKPRQKWSFLQPWP
jgi:hypothetical protein